MSEQNAQKDDPNRLTPEICNNILSAANSLVNQINYNVQYYLSWIAGEIESTGYEPLFEFYGNLAEEISGLSNANMGVLISDDYVFEFVGAYSCLVNTSDENDNQVELAEQLEYSLDACFSDGLGGVSEYGPRWGAELDISTEAFEKLGAWLSDFNSASVYYAEYSGSVPEQYRGPLDSAAATYSDLCYNTCSRYAESLYNMKCKFETGVEDTVSRARESGRGGVETGRLRWNL